MINQVIEHALPYHRTHLVNGLTLIVVPDQTTMMACVCILYRVGSRDEKENKTKLSNFLSDKLHHEYTYLSSFFSSVEGRTIENYFIEQRIEKAKELLVYGQMTLSEIAYELEYSSVPHLSSQFKKITGLTPSHFKQVGMQKRKSLDHI